MSDTDSKQLDSEVTEIKRKFNRLVRRAQVAEFIERAIPAAEGPTLVGAAFLATSWFGTWSALPVWGRVAGALAFTAALVVSPFITGKKSLWVTPEEAIKRIDSKIENTTMQPAMILGDKLSPNASDIEKHLWNTRVKQVWDEWGDELKAGYPKLEFGLGKKFAMAALGIAFSAGTLATQDRMADISEVMNWKSDTVHEEQIIASDGLNIKAFISPPQGIRIAPLYLDQNSRDERNGGDLLTVHEQSIMSILVENQETQITVNGEPLEMVRTMRSGSIRNPITTYVYEFPIETEDFVVDIAGGPSWSFNVNTDDDPSLDIITIDISNGVDGNSIGIDYVAQDDVGIEGGSVTLQPVEPVADDTTPLPSSEFNPIRVRPN